MWRWTVEGWSRCHQLMELGRGSSEKCLRNLQNVEMSSKSGREMASLGNWTEQLSRGSCCSRHLKWTYCQRTALSVVEQQKKYTCRSSLKSQVINWDILKGGMGVLQQFSRPVYPAKVCVETKFHTLCVFINTFPKNRFLAIFQQLHWIEGKGRTSSGDLSAV